MSDLQLRLSRLLEIHYDATDRNLVWCPTCRQWWEDEGNTIGGDHEERCEACARENYTGPRFVLRHDYE